MSEKEATIVIIDDDPVYRRLSRSILSERFNVYAVETGALGLMILKNEPVQFVILDYLLPDTDGLKTLKTIKRDFPDTEVIMISDSGDMDTVIEALREGAADYFRKPFSASDLWMSIERTQKLSELKKNLSTEKQKNRRLKEEIERELGVDLIGEAPVMKTIRDQMELVARTPDTSVLIIGESGTGKELVARGIHNLSARSGEVFHAVNMSAIPENLFESELFGHKKGSFTGAIADKMGWFESTDKGTLFLDEIGEMDLSLQVKLLRVLEDRQFSKVGGQKQQKFDIRIVAATNKSVEVLSGGQEFRLDLFHRLSTFIIHLPPLRERSQDIPGLTRFFLEKTAPRMGKPVPRIAPDVFSMLERYPFPGNIRELRNMVERAVILCPGDELKAAHFQIMPTQMKQEALSPGFDLRELEKQTIQRALEATQYNKAEAARLLNLEWNALYRRIQKYGIDLPED
ncbi:MAG: sigma-54 dependent transcriptional regulator [Bacteroidales bacterium]